MNNDQIGSLIRRLRLEKKMTQKGLANLLNVTEQAVSKWERGIGLPDISLLPKLSETLNVNLNEMLTGDLDENENRGGRMKEIHFYICPACDNLILGIKEANISCCGRTIRESVPQEAGGRDRMKVDQVEYDLYITSDHPMVKQDYISFSALLINGKLEVYSHYPEWNYELRIPKPSKSRLFWYSRKGGLKYQKL